MKRTTLLLIGIALFSSALAKKFWEEKPYTEWSQEQARSVLSRSPWAEEVTLGGSLPLPTDASNAASPSPGSDAQPGGPPSGATPTGITQVGVSDFPGGAGGAAQAGVSDFPGGPSAGSVAGGTHAVRRYYVRLQSAAPVRMALARLAMLQGRATAAQAKQYVETAPYEGSIVIAVEPPPGQERAEMGRLTSDRLKGSTYLLLKKGQEKIYLERYLAPAEAMGNDAIFLFPRVKDGRQLAPAAEEEIRFVSRLNSKAELSARFNLKNMVFNGKVEF